MRGLVQAGEIERQSDSSRTLHGYIKRFYRIIQSAAIFRIMMLHRCFLNILSINCKLYFYVYDIMDSRGETMKRFISVFLLILFAGMNADTVYANSAPYYWYQYPTSAVMTLEKDTPIAVLKEDLIFDFSSGEDEHFSLIGEVSAGYVMKNTLDVPTTSTMVFPFVRTLWETQEDIEVLVDGENAEFEIYYGDQVNAGSEDREFTMDLTEIMASVSREPYEPEGFSRDKEGTRYIITGRNPEAEGLEMKVFFSLPDESKAISKGMNSYGYMEGGDYELGTWIQEKEGIIEVFSLEGELQLEVKAYVSGMADAEELKDFDFEIREERMMLSTYYEGYFSGSDFTPVDMPETVQGRNLYYKALEQAFSQQDLVTEDMISMYLGEDRYVLITYEVPFQAMEEKTVEIRYDTGGVMDRRETADPTYTYSYLLHPARNWKDFQDLTIEVRPSKAYPYVLGSSPLLQRQEEGIYQGEFETLPEEDLTFTLYTREKITAMDRTRGFISANYYTLYFGGMILGMVLMTVILVLVVRKIEKKYFGKNKTI